MIIFYLPASGSRSITLNIKYINQRKKYNLTNKKDTNSTDQADIC